MRGANEVSVFAQKMVAAACAVCLAAVPSGIAGAAPIKFRMTGIIDVQFQVGPLPPGVVEGAPFEAILSYNLATPDSQPDDPHRGYYSTMGTENNFLLIRAGTSEMRSVDPLTFWVGNDVDVPQQIFEFRDDTFSMFDVPFEGNFEHSSVSKLVFRWNNPTRTVFTSDALPTSLDPAHFVEAFSAQPGPPDPIPPFIEVSTFQFDPRVYQFTFHAVVDSISVIPEPATLFGAVIGVIFLSGLMPTRRVSRPGEHPESLRILSITPGDLARIA